MALCWKLFKNPRKYIVWVLQIIVSMGLRSIKRIKSFSFKYLFLFYLVYPIKILIFVHEKLSAGFVCNHSATIELRLL